MMSQCKLKLLDAFAGIGGFSYAAHNLVGGFETKQFIEIDPYCQSVLKKNFPSVPIHDDIQTFSASKGKFDVLTAGFPCQDLSVAGSQRGIGEGTRSGLFYSVMRLVRELRPRFVLLENVRNLLSHQEGRTFQEVLFQIAQAGYDAEWSIVSARDVGACHKRERIWIIAYPKHDGLPSIKEQGIHDQAGNRDQTGQDTTLQSQGSSQSRSSSTLRGIEEDEESTSTNSNSKGSQGLRSQSQLRESSSEEEVSRISSSPDEQSSDPMCSGLEREIRPRFPGSIRWQTPPTSRRLNPQWREYVSQPTLCRGDDGLSNRIPRLKALGNTIVPACAAVPLQRIKHLSTYLHHDKRSIPRASQ